MYDEFEFDGQERAHPVRRWLRTGFLVVLGLAIVGTGAGVLVSHHRVDRANKDAVKYGVAGSTKHVSLTARCAGAVHAYYDTKSPLKTGIPPHFVTFLAPKVCAHAVQEGFVHPDGSMSYDDIANSTAQVMSQVGMTRVQTMVFTELAVNPYHLARQGAVTRLDRCLAMGYSGYDAQKPAVKRDFPARSRFFRAVREACTNGIALGLVPPTGAPTRRNTALLMREALSH
jgi:hypothetical protein